jgi:acetylglutamate kinase
VDPAEVVLRFLESVGRRSEAEFYLSLFRAQPKERFAAISVDANVVRQASEAVVLDLRFLAALGLTPAVLLGLMVPTEAAAHAARIARRLERVGVRSALLAAEDTDLPARVVESSRAGEIPLIAFAPETEAASTPPAAGSPVQLDDRFARLGALLSALATRKLIFLHRRGGLRQRGVQLELVNMTTDFASLLTSRELSPKERMLLQQAHRMLFERVRHKLLVAVTSPLDLLRELFTVQGAGTMLRRGSVILRHGAFTEIDGERLRALLASSFGRPPNEDFFTRPVAALYLEEAYRGVAILTDTPLGPYLTKFAVEREAQGEGIGRDIWDVLTTDRPTLFWRARATNPIGAWYSRRCDGLVRFPEWTIYWRGLPPARVPAAIEYALNQPVDIPPPDVEPSIGS